MIEWIAALQDQAQVERHQREHEAQRDAMWMADAIAAFDPFQILPAGYSNLPYLYIGEVPMG